MDNLTLSLYNKNYIKIFGEITPNMAKGVISKLLIKIMNYRTKEINILINSDGGCVTSAFMIYDVIKMAEKKGILVNTIAIGNAISSGCFLLVSGSKRYATENSIIMMHPMSYDAPMDYTPNNNNYMKFVATSEKKYYQIMANECFRNIDEKSESKLRDFRKLIKNSLWLTAEQAKDINWIDEIWSI